MQNNKDKQIVHLKEMFKEHLAIPFPQVTLNGELQGIRGEISLYGGHVAGLVTSYLNSAPINPDYVKVDAELEERIKNFKPGNSQEKKDIAVLMEYKHKLDSLLLLLSTLL